MENVLSYVTEVSITVLIVVATVLLGVLGAKVTAYLNNLKATEQFTLTHKIIENLIMFAESELTGKPGVEKREYVVEKAIELLAEKGIKANKDEILAGIEKGLSKMSDK